MAEYDRSNAAPPPLPMKYASGALRLTRTPGRQHAPNAISLDDLLHPRDLSSALVYSFFIEDPYLFDFFPLHSHCFSGPEQQGKKNRHSPLMLYTVLTGISTPFWPSIADIFQSTPRHQSTTFFYSFQPLKKGILKGMVFNSVCELAQYFCEKMPNC
ncbi:hypothetical protein B0H10DRAFT_809512 [Mycena sp. CBHHK59/15]|nr:hypothetical protein B0H10DRAFT_809512 [Mycena sp. CBHHK59/15]